MLKKWRVALWHWHRRLGYVLIVFIMLLSVTGILLNHTEDLQLDSQPVTQPALLALYGLGKPQVQSQPVQEAWLSHVDGQLYINGQRSQPCVGDYVGAVAVAPSAALPALYVVACREELLLLATDGSLIERYSATLGLPTPLEALGTCIPANTGLCFSAQQQRWLLDTEAGQWQPTDSQPQAPVMAQLPAHLQSALESQLLRLTWERVILDLHAGRLFGLGPWLMDAVGLAIMLLACSGLLSALARHRK